MSTEQAALMVGLLQALLERVPRHRLDSHGCTIYVYHPSHQAVLRLLAEGSA